MGLMDGLFGRKSEPRPLSPPVALSPLGVPAAEQRRAAGWFAGEAPEWVALGPASLRALAQARPQPVDPPPGNEDSLAWLPEALTRLEALSERVESLPANALPLPWRYLIFLRVLCDALEAAHQAALSRRLPIRCPLTRIADPYRPPRRWRVASPRVQAVYSGLGTLLAGVWLPEEGQKWIFSAVAQGVDWMDSAAFWAQVNAIGTPPAPSPPLPDAVPASTTAAPAAAVVEPRASAPPNATPRKKQAVSLQDAARASTTATPPPPPSLPEAETPEGKAPPLKDDEPFDTHERSSNPTELSQAVRQVLHDLIRHPLFNRQRGPGWRTEEAYWVTARQFAEQLMEQPWVKAQAFPNRRVIYHLMGRQGLLLPHGSNAVWSIFVTDPGEAQARLVPALKLPVCLWEGPLGLPYQGRLHWENPWALE